MKKPVVPHITIDNCFQKRKDKNRNILPKKILKDICKKTTGCSKLTIKEE